MPDAVLPTAAVDSAGNVVLVANGSSVLGGNSVLWGSAVLWGSSVLWGSAAPNSELGIDGDN
jgi:serine protease AprX